MFRTSVPATSEAFLDRESELTRLVELIAKLKAGNPSWLCILGVRKVGKTSLILELSRRARSSSVVFAVLDVLEDAPLSPEVFRRYALRVVDACLGDEAGVSFEALASRPSEYRAALMGSSKFAAMGSSLRSELLELVVRPLDDDGLRACLELPEQLAKALELLIVVAIDEFQELGAAFPGRKGADLFGRLRSIWQRHRRVAYVISGSARTMLLELVTSEKSPFFQHFGLMELGPFPTDEAIRLLVQNAPPDRRISPALAARSIEIIGSHPFYLQLFGEGLTQLAPPYDEGALKAALQDLLFSRTGRLSLYFENEFDRLVGKSSYLAATLEALSDGPKGLQLIANQIRSPSGATVRYLERLKDAVVHEGSKYRLADPTFGLWLSWRRPGGTVVPMRVIGSEAELLVAEHFARGGFDLVYQSRASRGAFDLLATRGASQLGVQVKQANLPLRLKRADWNRLVAEGKRLKWAWVVAVVTPEEQKLIVLDPRKVRYTAGGCVLSESARIENVLLWLDARSRR